jgi:uncharacterized protein involved in exopolysaccharide biosynthesis
LRAELGIPGAPASIEGFLGGGESDPLPLLTAETLRRLEALRIETKADYVRQMTLLDQLRKLEKNSTPEVLAQASATAAPDPLLNALLEQQSTAEQRLVVLTKDFGPAHTEVVNCRVLLEDLQHKIRSRVDGVMIGLDARVLTLSNSLENLNYEVALTVTNDVLRANKSRPYFEAKRNLEELQRFRQILEFKIAGERIDVELPRTTMVEIVDWAAPGLRPVSPNLPRALASIALGVLLDIAGLLMLTGRVGARSEPQPV